MKREQYISEDDWKTYFTTLSSKIKNGFVIEEKNDLLPFVVLSKKNHKVNHNFNFVMSCITLGIWLLVWFYLWSTSNRERKILIAMDEDGKTFVENCF